MQIRTSISILIGLGITSQAFAGWGTGWNVEMTNLTPRDIQVYPYNCKANSKAKNDTITIKLKNGDTRICSWKEKDTSSYSTPKCQYSFLKILIPIHVMQPAMFFAPDF
ncbi:hypothetical protein [Cysteiniphilum litorale]|uniref:Uncharacterized protein n=2 Tax=Cysteiniphilum TaxID=2056696 RepID=A0A8J2Z5K0_9GAMM|nr:hypothetical protein [Cysteiniphilum litorale]GGG01305.1 hypothetical protein GCM10010995_18440 [Cysteiniphilum litorale]